MSPITISKKNDFFGSSYDIKTESYDELKHVPKIIEALHKGKITDSELIEEYKKVFNESPDVVKQNDLSAKIKETIVLEPIKIVFTIFAGVIIASLIWYFGFN